MMAKISTHICMLVFIFVFLVFEIVVSQICRSLLVAVDSFHTLYVFINMALSGLKHHPSTPCSPQTSDDDQHYRRLRLRPFCILISALLMASQCVSISLEILTHLVQPEATQHPQLSIAVGGVSLLLNTLVLAWRRRIRAMDGGMQKSPHSAPEHEGSPCNVVESALQDNALMFCNPEASSALDPDQSSQDGSSSCQNAKAVAESNDSQKSQTSIREGAQEVAEPIEKLPEEQKPTVSQCSPEGSRFRKHPLGLISVIQDLLCSVLVLSNGLVLLLSHAHCHRPHSDCHLLVYLDAVFSTVCVVVLLSAALPRLHRYGLLVLQAAPLHLSVGQVRLSLGEVPGVLSVHELHVWQLSDALIVASLHVHCPAGMTAEGCVDLIANIKAVLSTFGIDHCTVQPEFVIQDRSDAAAVEGSGQSGCSLRCGQECVEKLCCSPKVDDSHCPKMEQSFTLESVEESTDMVIENTYL